MEVAAPSVSLCVRGVGCDCLFPVCDLSVSSTEQDTLVLIKSSWPVLTFRVSASQKHWPDPTLWKHVPAFSPGSLVPLDVTEGL